MEKLTKSNNTEVQLNSLTDKVNEIIDYLGLTPPCRNEPQTDLPREIENFVLEVAKDYDTYHLPADMLKVARFAYNFGKETVDNQDA